MEDYLTKTYKWLDIRNFIETKTEESINLDFKAAEALNHIGGSKDEIDKDVSAFANSDGGVIVYGIKEVNHRAAETDFIDGNRITKEQLEQIINARIHRRIQGVVIDAIRHDENINESFYVIKIPKSLSAPHQAKNRKFYKRFNFESVEMEEYEVRDSYNRIEQTILEILEPKFSGQAGNLLFPSIEGVMREYNAQVEIGIKNVGRAIEKIFKLEIKIPSKVKVGNKHWVGIKPLWNYYSGKRGNYEVYSVPNISPLFQDEELSQFAIADLTITESTYDVLLKNPIKIKLYYSNGTAEREIFAIENLIHRPSGSDPHPLSKKCFIESEEYQLINKRE